MNLKIKSALVSVFDKENITPLLKCLKKHKIKIISSGGTYKAIKKLGYACTELSKYTGFEEMLDGRVKTLHPKIHAGILHDRQNKKHKSEMSKRNFPALDLIVVNFYPFEEILSNTRDQKKIIENIDIGGPTMVRAAAKNYKDVTVITSDTQYDELIENIKLFTEVNKQIFEKIISKLNSEEKLSIDLLDIDSQLIDKITKFAPIKHILQKKNDQDHEVLELLQDIIRDLNNYDLEFRIQELESKFSKDLSETTFNELKELKKKQNIN